MTGRYTGLFSPAIGAEGGVVAYGHWGRPLLAFPSQQGSCLQYEERGMIHAIADLIEAGRVKVYAVDSFDSGSWYRTTSRSRSVRSCMASTRTGS